MRRASYSKGVEKLIDPIVVGSLHFIESFNRLLPKSIQKKLVKSSARSIPHMGFVVEPYSFFLCYEIANLDQAKELLPNNFNLVKTRIFNDDEPKYYGIIGCFRAHTSAFWGVRTEFYIIAEDKITGMLSWIIVDYDTDTISYDTQNGLRSPNSQKTVVTVDYTGTLFVDVKRKDNSRGLEFSANIKNGQIKGLDQRLWLEGNLSVGYGRILSNGNADIFSLKFEPEEVKEALNIPLSDFDLNLNSWYPGLLNNNPSQLVCFPYAQHFVSDSPGYASNIKNKDDLEAANNALRFDQMQVLSSGKFTKMFMVGMAVSFAVTVILVVLLIIK
jgi:hypothetical protein